LQNQYPSEDSSIKDKFKHTKVDRENKFAAIQFHKISLKKRTFEIQAKRKNSKWNFP
jgi:hypothetical protein